MKKEHLIEIGLADQRWADDARWIVAGGWDVAEVAEDEARKLRRDILSGELTLQDLREGVRWANALDREAVELYGADLSQGEQGSERAARRLMHLAGRSALRSLKNRTSRVTEIARNHHLSVIIDRQAHDMYDIDLVQ